MTSVEEEMAKDGIKNKKTTWDSAKNAIPSQEITDWQAYYKAQGYADPDTLYNPEERQVLDKKHKVIIIDEDDDMQAEANFQQDWDEGAQYDDWLNKLFPRKLQPTKLTSCQLKKKGKKGKKKKTITKLSEWGGYFGQYSGYWRMKESDKVIQITEKAFHRLRDIALKEYLYRNVEAGAFLYGKNNLITHVRHYRAIGSSSLITGNAVDIHRQMTKKNFMGIFHSHTFSSSAPSGTDHECLHGWTNYARAFGKKDPVSIIGCLPHFKQECYSMDEKMSMQKHKLEVI